ncbi:MAG: molybdopterin-dependent oxidoreductase [Actinomycetia bacterium]|nr:molybdopterin-dependent oxidoreductase [Actinomycetes bacterium]
MSVGISTPRSDAPAKVTGETLFPADLHRVDALHAKVVFSNRPHARMLDMDVSATLATPGVIEVVTAADVPVNEYGLTLNDQPVLVGLGDTGRSDVPADISRWEADQIAVVVAETRQAADEGAKRLAVSWEDLPLVPDLDAALSGTTLVHPENGLDTNIYHQLRFRVGDMEEGWRAADVVVEGTYVLPHQEHAYLQPEAALAYLDHQSRITVEIAGQWTHEDQAQIAHALDMDVEDIRVIYPAIGGAFGGREDMSLQIVLALAVRKLARRGIRRPVRTVWSREESIIGHHKRHRAVIHARWGATRDGLLTAVQSEGWLDAGAYNYTSNKVLGNMHVCSVGPYRVPNIHTDSRVVYTHSVPGGAFRGFGAPQGALAAEGQMNRLAAELGMDPVAIRLLNCYQDGDIGAWGEPVPPVVSLPEVIEACAEQADWGKSHQNGAAPFCVFRSVPADASRLRRGRGFACGFKNIGFSFGFPERCVAGVELWGGDEVEQVVLYHAGAEVGQGAHTVFKQIAAEAAGVSIDAVETHYSDTATSGDAGSSSASRMTWMGGNSILGAVEEAQKRWIDGDRPALGRFRFTPPPTESMDPRTGKGNINFAYGWMAEVVDVTVDVDTGHLRLESVVCAVDVGRAINPQLVKGQIEGAVAQAHGYAVTEQLLAKDGRIFNPNLSTYLMPGIGDIPGRVESVILEIPDPNGPLGVRGMAEMPMIPLAPAVSAAVYDAVGVWFTELPLTPEQISAGLHSG